MQCRLCTSCVVLCYTPLITSALATRILLCAVLGYQCPALLKGVPTQLPGSRDGKMSNIYLDYLRLSKTIQDYPRLSIRICSKTVSLILKSRGRAKKLYMSDQLDSKAHFGAMASQAHTESNRRSKGSKRRYLCIALPYSDYLYTSDYFVNSLTEAGLHFDAKPCKADMELVRPIRSAHLLRTRREKDSERTKASEGGTCFEKLLNSTKYIQISKYLKHMK